MSLATRCSACGTIFRVVEDQLRVSDGWVRCGRCAEVFDARAQIFDIDREAPPPWPTETPASPPPAPAPTPAPTPAPLAPAHSRQPDPGPAAWAEETPKFEPRPSQLTPDHPVYPVDPELDTAAEPLHEQPQNSRLDARLEPHWSDEQAAPAPAQAALASALPSPQAEPPAMDLHADINERPDVVLGERLAQHHAPAQAKAEAPADNAAIPEFLRTQATRTKWRNPKRRIALSLLALLLLSALLLQAGLHYRNTVAAIQPGLRPALQAACAFAGCEILPRQHIESIGVESSALNQAGPGNQYQLVVGLRNKSSTEVATPWVELSLTDSAGALVAKRILAPADFKSDKLAMPAGSDLALQTLLSTGSNRVSGYSVEIFYP
ncbi:zinc-ribbon domain-containing protein [Paucibacter sp. B2R-40]|uniref:zinc-ribbon and DUF3426 domain-containing protein n=1 Tax=Paucibacter sp. B2R-40 TaxID=2893554 RepID=UPI0021E4C62D|nr:zinc-ribbon and DUF3426 domain-containing protein [Paucibacter sp. B2R-40]MCV2355316.1 zinc-ribbon domain-containing protein [Paucibacter sp. B2R-40]